MEWLKVWKEIECECGERCFYHKTEDVDLIKELQGHNFLCNEK